MKQEEKPARWLEYMDIEALQGAKRNPKQHAEEQIQGSYERFGQVEVPALDERTGRLVAGHGRRDALLALKKAGKPPPEGVEVGQNGAWRMPVLRGWKSPNDTEFEAYLVGSNEWVVAGGWDESALASVVKDLHAEGAMEGLGFSQDRVDELLAGITYPEGLELEDEELGTGEGAPTRYCILVECEDQEQQRKLLKKFEENGLNCRALDS